jgi:hypothetical protein
MGTSLKQQSSIAIYRLPTKDFPFSFAANKRKLPISG